MFCYIDSTSGTSDTAIGTGDPCFRECSSIPTQYKDEVKEDLWMLGDYWAWGEYLKTLWLDVLRVKQYFNAVQFSKCILYYRRLLFSVSGYLPQRVRARKN